MSGGPKQLIVLSGKGGTGKTSVTAALAHLASQDFPISLADADVDASNLELVLHPRQLEVHEFISGLQAKINPDLCVACGQCYAGCRFDAIIPTTNQAPYQVDSSACEGCAACYYRCTVNAISMESLHAGQWFHSETPYGPLYHAYLFAGGENSGKLVTLVKQQARLRALDDHRHLVLVDGPPGIGCPVISAISGASLALLVVEPTRSGVHDLARVLELTRYFEVSALVLINKADLSAARVAELEQYCAEQEVPVIAHVPYDTVITEAMVNGQPVTAFTSAPVTHVLRETWESLKTYLALSE